MTRLFIDCEWNSYKGDLISMALVSESGHEWYAFLGCDKPHSWVRENVLIHTEKEIRMGAAHARKSLEIFLSQFQQVFIVADWPEDIARFCDFIISGPGEKIQTPELSFIVINAQYDPPDWPQKHHALADARQLKAFSWSEDRKIIPRSTPLAQWRKAQEELYELQEALMMIVDPGSGAERAALGADLAKDAIGDVSVCLINIARLLGWNMAECLAHAYSDIKDRKGTLGEDGIFVKE